MTGPPPDLSAAIERLAESLWAAAHHSIRQDYIPAPQEPTVTDRTPAETLTAAAKRLLVLAEPVHQQHPGPWSVHNPNGYPQAVFSPASDVILCETLDEIDQPKPTAAYIAAMHPGVGAALAAWLTEAARSHEAFVVGAASVWRRPEQAEERDAWVADQTDQAALAVACQILGEAS